MEPDLSPSMLEQDGPTVHSQLQDEIDDSEYQVLWNITMDKGEYNQPSTYKKVEVLLLCWAQNSNDLKTEKEVKKLESIFQTRFRYGTRIAHLDNDLEQKLQVQVNAKVAHFVGEHDGANTLLIVYYAGHGRPGQFRGDLEWFGKCSPNEGKKHLDIILWNNTEKLLEPAEADILELFDCCHAGALGLRGQPRYFRRPLRDITHLTRLRLFEYLAATTPEGTTRAPGPDSFTSALIYSLEKLVKERPDGHFTIVELLQTIMNEAPGFPKDQKPIINDRQHNAEAGRIVLHPLPKEGSTTQVTAKESANTDPADRHMVTLHLDFSDKPSKDNIKKLGTELNTVFEHHRLGVNRIRWGGIQCNRATLVRHVKSFIASIGRKRKRRERALSNGDLSEGLLSPVPPFTPASTNRSSHPSPQTPPHTEHFGTHGETSEILKRTLETDEETDGMVQDRRKRPKLSVKQV